MLELIKKWRAESAEKRTVAEQLVLNAFIIAANDVQKAQEMNADAYTKRMQAIAIDKCTQDLEAYFTRNA